MPEWYLILSAVVALVVLGAVAYSALTDTRRTTVPEGFGADYDDTFADAPTRREAEEAPSARALARDELVQRRR